MKLKYLICNIIYKKIMFVISIKRLNKNGIKKYNIIFEIFWILMSVFGNDNKSLTISIFPLSAAICNAVKLKLLGNCINKLDYLILLKMKDYKIALINF